MNLLSAILALLCLLLAGLALFLFLRQGKLRAELSLLAEDAKKREASQAQVMHTTKLASLGQMIAGVAHEINTPLGFVKSNAEVIGDLLTEYEQAVAKCMTGVDFLLNADAATFERAKTAVARVRMELANAKGLIEARELLSDSVDGLKQMSALVINLKGFARVDRDGMDLVDINECVQSALTIASHQLRDRVTVTRELSKLPKVRCMPSQINQVFMNLITNAAQAMGEEGRLVVRSRALTDTIEVSIEDNGAGIPANVLPKIFDPFFTTKKVGEGTGLGLSIVHKIVQGHGGTIRVKSDVGKGTTFFVELPIQQKEAKK